jgi:peptidoglycan/LPS O-acetylase OafA/YrhL
LRVVSSSRSFVEISGEEIAESRVDPGVLQIASKYRPDIDGLRAIAITSVVAYHIGLNDLKGGFVGVDIFFVISGYLIGFLVYKQIRDNEFAISKFYARRAKRILPALFSVLTFCYLCAFLLLSPHEMKNFIAEVLSTITSSSNILYALFTPGYFHPNTEQKTLLMTWTLGVEEQFYILFPISMMLMKNASVRVQKLGIGSVAALSLLASAWGTIHYPILAYYLLPTRAWELAAGVLLAIFEANRLHGARMMHPAVAHGISVLGLALITTSIFVFNQWTPFPGYAALLPVLGTVMIIAAQQGIVNQVLSWRPIVFVGLVSYSWYLWHWPILTFARICCAAGISTEKLCMLALLSFGCAVVSYKIVEQPFRERSTPAIPLLKQYGVLALVMILAAGALYASRDIVHGDGPLKQLV